MIPEKLYIPTSTLNLNNIMSSESVSPASFYSRRGFGFKRFEKVLPNNLNNRIILYEKYPVFNINDNELENYPMVIEINAKIINEDVIKEQSGEFFTEETIYLNPFSTKIFFRNKQEKITTLSKTEPSVEAKMVGLYESCFETKQQNIESYNWIKSEIEDSNNDISRHISKDRKINKQKGLLYAYLLSANKSLSADVVSLKKYIKNIHNTLSAIITSPDGRATYTQEEQLESLYRLINNKFQSHFLAPILKEKAEIYQCDFYRILDQENLFEVWLRQNNFMKYRISRFTIPAKEKDRALDNYMRDLEKQILNIEARQNKSNLDVSNCLPTFENNRLKVIPEQKDFLVKLFNEYLEEAYNSEEFMQSRYEFAKSGGKIFKEELQDKWEGSHWQQYINALLKNLNEYSSFDIKSANNLTLESFAAFCQKGESDIDKLEDYLITNEIGDFRIAFSLWGIIFGFANMPKTLTNDLFLSEDTDYISMVYKSIFKQIHGIDLNGKVEKIHNQSPSYENISLIVTLPSPIQTSEIPKKTIDNQDIRKALKNCKLKPEQLDSIYEIYLRNHSTINDKFFIQIKKINGVGKKAIEKVKASLHYIDIQPKKSVQKEDDPSLFEEIKPEIGKEFYKDVSIWYHIASLIPKEKQKKVKTEIDWIQKVHKENGYQKKSGEWVPLEDHSNQIVIKHFENNAKNRIESQLLIKIVEKLRKLYFAQ